MLFLLDKDVKTVKWNGIPLHEASSAIVKEETNGDFMLTVRYPITDSGIYQLIQEDMLIKAPTPVLGAQLFRIKKPVENDDSMDITAYHITDDVMQRSIKPVSVVGQGCAMALSQMVQNAKTGLGDFSFTSDITDNRTFNTDEAKTLYSVLMDGKHSIVGTWEGELVRDNFALSIKRSRGADRGVVITTHKNLKSYQRTKNSQGVVTRIHARSTFKAEGAEEDTVLTVTVDSPLIGNYPYINEKEYQNNDLKTVEELKKWAEAKFKHEDVDKVSDAIEIEAYELDGQVVHLGDTVNLKSRKHNADLYKKAIAYEFNALTEEYIFITFDDKPGVGGSGVSSGLSNAADAILGASASVQDVAVERAVKNANAAFDAEFNKRVEAINDDIEKAKADAEVYADTIRQDISQEFDTFEREYQANKAAQEQQVSDIRAQATDAKTIAQQAQQIGTQAKVDAIAEAIRLIASARQSLDGQLAQQAQQLLTQASAQEQLTRRTSAVEQLANSTKTTLTELSKTVNDQTGQIVNVSERTKVVEDGIAGLTTRYENFSIGTNNLIPSSRTMSGNGWYTDGATLEDVTVSGYPFTFKRWTSGNKNSPIIEIDVKANMTYTFTAYIARENVGRLYFYLYDLRHHHITSTTPRETIIENVGPEIQRFKITFIPTRNGKIRPRFAMLASDAGWMMTGGFMLVQGAVSGDYRESDLDIIAEQALYKQTVEQNLAEISRQTQTTAGDVSQLKTFREQTVSQLRDVVSASQFDSLTGRMTQLETDITTQAGELAKRLTRTQVEQAITDRGYQTKSQVDSNIAGRGYITASALQPYATTTTVQNLVTETAGSFERKITETKALIPTSTSVNLVDGTKDFSGSHFLIDGNWGLDGRTVAGADVLTWQSGNKASPTLTWQVESGKEYIFSAYVAKQTTGTVYFYLYNDGSDNITSTTRRNHHIDGIGTDFKRFTLHFVPTRSGKIRARFAIMASDVGGFSVAGYQLLEGRLEQPWGPSAKELSAVTGFNTVKDTVDAHKRLIGDGSSISQAIQSASKFERSIVAGGDIYQAIETAKGLVQEVTGADGLKSQMSQLAGSWAVKNLTSAGTVLNQINLLANGTNRIDGGLTHITGQTLIDNAVIKSAMIDKLKTANFESGSVTAAILAANSVTADKLVVDQALFNKLMANEAYLKQLFAKNAFITQVQSVTMSANQISGGILKAINNAMQIQLNNGQILYYTDQAALKRILSGYPTQFVKFATGTSSSRRVGVTVIGSNRNGTESSNDGGFVGIRAWNGAQDDSIDVVGDTVRLASSAYEDSDGWDINTLPGKLDIDAHRTSDRPSSKLNIGDVYLFRTATNYISLKEVLQQFNTNFKHLVNITGRGDVIETWNTIK
ncbi:phage tail spike protein [Streptococcus hillyeri]|uniref:phage tail spike protein n=1 Tax=Streptococcus hillyeri TaxID=2282420 RepID=UPI001FE8DD98|nr:phage tail spike protein [Streptococcus hillyeri]